MTAIDASVCCPVAAVIGLLVLVVWCCLRLSGTISEAEERAGRGRRS